jgi:hypothetical protein
VTEPKWRVDRLNDSWYVNYNKAYGFYAADEANAHGIAKALNALETRCNSLHTLLERLQALLDYKELEKLGRDVDEALKAGK